MRRRCCNHSGAPDSKATQPKAIGFQQQPIDGFAGRSRATRPLLSPRNASRIARSSSPIWLTHRACTGGQDLAVALVGRILIDGLGSHRRQLRCQVGGVVFQRASGWTTTR